MLSRLSVLITLRFSYIGFWVHILMARTVLGFEWSETLKRVVWVWPRVGTRVRLVCLNMIPIFRDAITVLRLHFKG